MRTLVKRHYQTSIYKGYDHSEDTLLYKYENSTIIEFFKTIIVENSNPAIHLK